MFNININFYKYWHCPTLSIGSTAVLVVRNSKRYKTHANLALNGGRNPPPNQFMRFSADHALTNLSELGQISHNICKRYPTPGVF